MVNLPTQIVINALDDHEEDFVALVDEYNFRDERELKGGLESIIFEVLTDVEYDALMSEIVDYFFQHVDFDAVIARYLRKE